jgi:hypothetical protein
VTETTEWVVAELKIALGTDYRLVRHLTGGLQSGAHELTAGGARVVLKWSDDPGWASSCSMPELCGPDRGAAGMMCAC